MTQKQPKVPKPKKLTKAQKCMISVLFYTSSKFILNGHQITLCPDSNVPLDIRTALENRWGNGGLNLIVMENLRKLDIICGKFTKDWSPYWVLNPNMPSFYKTEINTLKIEIALGTFKICD